jgi:polar amino acid transport system substrate-binding protein
MRHVKVGKFGKHLALGAAAAALLVTSACTSSGKHSEANSNAAGAGNQMASSQLTKILKRGELRVAVLPDFPPWSLQKPDGSFEGYEVDIAKDLAASMGVKVKLVATNGDSRLANLQSDRVDVNISSWTATNKRALKAAFTDAYDAHGAGVLYPKNKPITSYSQLAGKSISVARGSTNDTIVTKDFPSAKVQRFDSIADAIAAVKTGKVDVCVESSYTVGQEAKKDSSLGALNDPPLEPALISMGIQYGDTVWMDYLDNYIRNLNSSGLNDKLHEKWLGAPQARIVGNLPPLK